jgi:hypothetical protein
VSERGEREKIKKDEDKDIEPHPPGLITHAPSAEGRVLGLTMRKAPVGKNFLATGRACPKTSSSKLISLCGR